MKLYVALLCATLAAVAAARESGFGGKTSSEKTRQDIARVELSIENTKKALEEAANNLTGEAREREMRALEGEIEVLKLVKAKLESSLNEESESTEETRSGFSDWLSNVGSHVHDALSNAKESVVDVFRSGHEKTKQALARVSQRIQTLEKKLEDAKDNVKRATNKFQAKVSQTIVDLFRSQIEGLKKLKEKLERLVHGSSASSEVPADPAAEPPSAVPEQHIDPTERAANALKTVDGQLEKLFELKTQLQSALTGDSGADDPTLEAVNGQIGVLNELRAQLVSALKLDADSANTAADSAATVATPETITTAHQ